MYVDNAMNRKQKFPQFHDHFLHTHSIIIYTFTNLPITFNSPSVLCSGPSPFVRQSKNRGPCFHSFFYSLLCAPLLLQTAPSAIYAEIKRLRYRKWTHFPNNAPVGLVGHCSRCTSAKAIDGKPQRPRSFPM